MSEIKTEELACIYSGLLLQDDGIEITADKIKTLLEAANITVASHWPGLYARSLAKVNIPELLLNAGSSGAAGAAPVAAATSAAAPAAAAKKETKKEEVKKEESDDDMGMGLFD
ncbi:ribosomal acidic phosphoprotein P1 [Dictyostelium discoideum AX4]|uniref:Large ribosomal subunit protein P1 n=1 Tax=Dictyostelium discoideum TaxID=44689 RepID=RLA1_DICDI|nr:ribosomal acidic phosphoprotein P1 [Dictyostelium discoideum AX4]P22684.1 RecName: Full=Large ribosomal subunit protein P1; AltName: Full=60S acidic ribosomal protein P1 [Dictyostelium discoideum]EAL68126.1 ribosomal acidic phosphoprotein P1 [Dictyostelium discoideum AX4]CAA39656.1 ribosomal acidic phosphoprotein P1 [Dictyostelium discoideum]|eukprot:XP_642424.1 ribosomal acidic phosphoprotein P1 [Dictyostelium discoideum AX4]